MKVTRIIALILIALLIHPASQAVEETDDPDYVENPLLNEPKKFEALEKQSNFQLLRYKPIYFAYNNPITKLQFSFRSPLVENFRLYFGYSQIIFWKLNAKSKPFLDATYNPELFYRFILEENEYLKSIDYGVWEHQSNGKADDASRSFDQTYAKANFVFERKNWLISTYAKVAYKFDYDSTNKDIEKYIGPVEFQISFIRLYSRVVDKSEITFTARPGGKFGEDWSRGGYELGYNFRLGGLKVVPSLYMQYYSGYGETLLTYNKRDDRWRFGFVF